MVRFDSAFFCVFYDLRENAQKVQKIIDFSFLERFQQKLSKDKL